MKTFKFLCVSLLCTCAAGLDLDASKSNDISSLFTYNHIMVAWTNFLIFLQMSICTTKLSFATYTGGLQTDMVTVNFLLRILTQCCAPTSSTHLLSLIISPIQFRVTKTVNLIQKKMVNKIILNMRNLIPVKLISS